MSRLDAASPADAKTASTGPWKTAQNAVSHSAHTHHQLALHTKILTLPKLRALHRRQVLSYLKTMNLRIGLVFNFNTELMKHGFRRVVN